MSRRRKSAKAPKENPKALGMPPDAIHPGDMITLGDGNTYTVAGVGDDGGVRFSTEFAAGVVKPQDIVTLTPRPFELPSEEGPYADAAHDFSLWFHQPNLAASWIPLCDGNGGKPERDAPLSDEEMSESRPDLKSLAVRTS
jgi:hypothetical protein